jgi:hypothetical protein
MGVLAGKERRGDEAAESTERIPRFLHFIQPFFTESDTNCLNRIDPSPPKGNGRV